MDTTPVRLYPRGTYLCVICQDDLSTLLLCQTCTVVTTHSITIPVIWLKESEKSGLFRPSFKSIIPTTSILEEVKVVKREKGLVEVDQSQIPRLKKQISVDATSSGQGRDGNESVCSDTRNGTGVVEVSKKIKYPYFKVIAF